MWLRLFQSLKHSLTGFSICARIAIGNAAIIVVGATVGTALARHLSGQQAGPALMISLILAGSGLSIAASYLVTQSALKPLIRLRQHAEKAEPLAPSSGLYLSLPNPDPDTCRIGTILNGLIGELETSNRQLKAIHNRAIGAQEEERKRIARWLHDDTGQALISLILLLDRLTAQIPADQPEIRNQITAARERASQTLSGLRTVIQGLRPLILDDLGLVPSIRWYARETLEEAGIRSEVDCPEQALELPPDLTITLFRIAQEAINNIAHHARAQSARIGIAQEDNKVILRIEDDGCGFQTAENSEEAMRKRHWGLIGIQERLDRVGGTLELSSEPGRGTLIKVSVPLNRREEAWNEQKDPHPAGG